MMSNYCMAGTADQHQGQIHLETTEEKEESPLKYLAQKYRANWGIPPPKMPILGKRYKSIAGCVQYCGAGLVWICRLCQGKILIDYSKIPIFH